MPRLTKSEIEQRLLAGAAVAWKDASGKQSSIHLAEAKQRRLFEYLLASKIRDPKGFSSEFVDGLATAFLAANDPATSNAAATINPAGSGPWKIHSVKAEGFGGVNVWGGKPFELSLDRESLLIEGPNGSGKSSFTAAIIWGLTGERPRDQDDSSAEEARPVFNAADKEAGVWPPVAAYPPDSAGLKSQPSVSVEITFSDPSGKPALARRTFDGKQVAFNADPALTLPAILLEAGLLMPARLPQLRLDKGKGRLTDAVQKLTGLDDLIELGALIQGLCHKSREYQSYKTAELDSAQTEFGKQVERARAALGPVSLDVPNFKPSDTGDKSGALAQFGKTLNEKAAELTKAITDDLASGLVLSDPQVQKQVGLELAGAEQDLAAGLSALPTWETLQTLYGALNQTTRNGLLASCDSAQTAFAAAQNFHEKEQADNRYRLKAIGARWHQEHDVGAIESCPLCQVAIKDPALRKELEELRNAGEAATLKLSDNINAILMGLANTVPLAVRRYLYDPLPGEPRASLLADFRDRYVAAGRYTKYLRKFGSLAEACCNSAPASELSVMPELDSASQAVADHIAKIRRMCDLADWVEAEQQAWSDWWSAASTVPQNPAPDASENLISHLRRLKGALGDAEPYRVAADAMRQAWQRGVSAAAIEAERTKRAEIADALSPLKRLGELAEAQARNAIEELSGRIGAIHKATYLADQFQFQSTSLEKKAGLIVRGKFSDEIRVDATLVANTSWLRGILWAFIFALREEAVEQIGADIFPVMVFDDPQQTFDSEHRHRWAEMIAKLQNVSGVQVVLTTHEERLLSVLEMDGVTGRKALIASAGKELGHIGIFEGDALDRRWSVVQKVNTPEAARDYMKEVREYTEALLRIMLRGEDITISTDVIGNSRQRLDDLHKKGVPPWSGSAFKNLAGSLGKGVKEIKFVEEAHHGKGGLAEGVDVEKYWRTKLHPELKRAFIIARDFRALHGGLTALHALPPTVELPEGYKARVRTVELPLLGTAAALTDGRAADGCFDLSFGVGAHSMVKLGDHLVFRLLSPTLEPVARRGDLLLVREHKEPTEKSLVVALSEDRLLARRLQIAENHSDVAVLTANAINPRIIAPPVVAKFSTLTLKKVVGVLFDSEKNIAVGVNSMEIADCGGEARFASALEGAHGLVEVVGSSAEPYALDKQFLIIGSAAPFGEIGAKLKDRPVIAEDSNGSRYFKRLRLEADIVILESLEIGGDFPPVILAKEPKDEALHITNIWPVLGILFENSDQ